MAENKSSAKVRNRGRDWQAIARGRSHVARTFRTTRGVTNVPDAASETGSAAYRRLLAKQAGKAGRK